MGAYGAGREPIVLEGVGVAPAARGVGHPAVAEVQRCGACGHVGASV
eukprot:SAG11_NODE_3682_length_2287_cov_3.219835_3_plen_47_part_00